MSGKSILGAGRAAHAALLVLLVSLPLTYGGVQAGAANNAVDVWETTADGVNQLTPQTAVAFADNPPASSYTITVDDSTSYQQMIGYGATITDSSAWLLNGLSQSARDAVMSNLFGSNGSNSIGLNFLRQPMGATDFIVGSPGNLNPWYTYDDVAGDTSLSSFSIGHDLPYLVPMIKAALAVNPNILVQFNSWSAPAWMKDTGQITGGGNLLPQYDQVYANYLVKAIKAYEDQGIPIWVTTPQNEPNFASPPESSEPAAAYPTMQMSAAQEADFVRNYLAPTLANATFPSTRPLLMIGDYGPFDATFAPNVFQDPVVSAFSSMSDSHGYVDPVTNLTAMHDKYPDKAVLQTELSPGCPTDPSHFPTIDLVIQAARNWAETAVPWNVALDPNGKPDHYDTDTTCSPLVTIDNSGNVTYTKDYYQEGQASKFVQRGAYRIASPTFSGHVEDVAFRNPDGSHVLVVHNTDTVTNTFVVKWGSQGFSYTLPADGIATFVWSGTGTDQMGWGNSLAGTDPNNPYGGGLERGPWTIHSDTAVDSTGLGTGWNSIYAGRNRSSFATSVDVERTGTGTQSSQKYGMYACYIDGNNRADAWIDPGSGVFRTEAVVSGVATGWNNNIPLPPGFNPSQLHTIKSVKQGSQFTFFLDGVQMGSPQTYALGNCQVGLVTEDTTTDFQKLEVTPIDWGDAAYSPNDPGNLYGGGNEWGSWSTPSDTSATNTGLGNGWQSIYQGDLKQSYTVSAQIQLQSTGTTSSTHKYGLYAFFENEHNRAEAYIDPSDMTFGTEAVVGGVSQGFQTTPLPPGIVLNQPHTISVTKQDNTFTFSLDGTVEQTRIFNLAEGQVGLFTEDTQASFQAVSVTDLPGWGDSTYGTVPASVNPYGGGTQTGTWSFSNSTSAISTTVGSGWDSIYRGGQLSTFTVSADVERVVDGGSPSKYGIYVCYHDENNRAEAFIDPNAGVLRTEAVVNGNPTNWNNNIALPSGFDPTTYHTIKAIKVGDQFYFYLDGQQMGLPQTYAIDSCQVGLVTENTEANFRNVSVSNVG